MRTFVRWAIRVAIAVMVLVIAVFLLRETLVRIWVEHQLSNEIGLPVKIGSLKIGLRKPYLTIENFVIYNDAEFGGSPFLEIAECHVEYDRAALQAGKFHGRLVRFNVAALHIVEDQGGHRNLEALGKRLEVTAGDKGQLKEKESAKMQGFAGIDTLNLTLGRLTYQRLGQPGKIEELKLNVDHQIFKNIQAEEDFYGVLFVAVLRSGVNPMPRAGSRNWLEFFSPSKN